MGLISSRPQVSGTCSECGTHLGAGMVRYSDNVLDAPELSLRPRVICQPCYARLSPCCGGTTTERRGKLICNRCGGIIEGCCEGAPVAGTGCATEPPLRVYIAGPMRGVPYFNYPAFDAARDKFKSLGWEVESPADHDRERGLDPFTYPDGYDWNTLPEGFDLGEVLVETCAPAVRRSDTIYLLKGWERSRGALWEFQLASMLGKELVYE